jgi:anaerobic ribonucleoside-triphosphate reductase activating protein
MIKEISQFTIKLVEKDTYGETYNVLNRKDITICTLYKSKLGTVRVYLSEDKYVSVYVFDEDIPSIDKLITGIAINTKRNNIILQTNERIISFRQTDSVYEQLMRYVSNSYKLQVAGFYDNSSVNGPGLRSVLFVSGCKFNCPDCQNKEAQSMTYGDKVSVGEVVKRIKSNIPIIDGVTLSGGEPTLQSEALLDLVKDCKKLGLNVWMYTGDKYENLMKDPVKSKLVKSVDVLVDGRYVKELNDPNLLYRGSSNQRIIDVSKSTVDDIVLWDESEDF